MPRHPPDALLSLDHSHRQCSPYPPAHAQGAPQGAVHQDRRPVGLWHLRIKSMHAVRRSYGPTASQPPFSGLASAGQHASVRRSTRQPHSHPVQDRERRTLSDHSSLSNTANTPECATLCVSCSGVHVDRAAKPDRRKTSFSRRTPMACGQATPIKDERLCRIQAKAMNLVPEPLVDSSSSLSMMESALSGAVRQAGQNKDLRDPSSSLR